MDIPSINIVQVLEELRLIGGGSQKELSVGISNYISKAMAPMEEGEYYETIDIIWGVVLGLGILEEVELKGGFKVYRIIPDAYSIS